MLIDRLVITKLVAKLVRPLTSLVGCLVNARAYAMPTSLVGQSWSILPKGRIAASSKARALHRGRLTARRPRKGKRCAIPRE